MSAATAAASRVTRHAAPRIAGRFVPRSAAVVIILFMFAATLRGQAPFNPVPATAGNTATVAAASAATANAQQVRLLVGRSTLIQTDTAITRVSLTTADVADAMVTSPQQLLVHGKAPGTISLLVWDRIGMVSTYEVVVERDLSLLMGQVRNLFPGEPIEVAGSGKDIVLSGTVTSKYVVEKAAEVAAGYVEKKENVVNLLRQEEGVASNQVLLRVRFAEVSRNAMSELGVNFFSDGHDNKFGAATTQQFPAPFFDQRSPMLGKSLIFSDYLNLFLFDAGNSLGAVVKALQNKGLFQSLAEPNLIAQNGKEATFLAGGEYPYPAVQSSAGATAVTIVFKEFGIRLSFTPTVLQGDIINLKVKPEVSSLDFANAVTLQGFTVPSLSTRRAETEVELRDGQTFAIAGLLNNTLTESMQKIPGIGDIPVLGLLFRSRALQKSETELVVMITPQILRRNSTGVTDRLPDLHKEFMEPGKNPIPAPPPYAPKQPDSSMQKPGGVQPSAAPSVAEPLVTMVDGVPEIAPMAPSTSRAAVVSALEPPVSKNIKVEETSADRQMAKAQMKADKQAAEIAEKQAKKAAEQAEKDRKVALERAQENMKAERAAAAEQAKIDAELAKHKAQADQKIAARMAQEAEEKAERDGKEARKQAEIDKKREKIEAEVARRKAEEDRKTADRLAREQARRDGENAKRNAELAQEQAEINKKRAKVMEEAAAKLREAQQAYEAELQRVAKMNASKENAPPQK